MVPTAVFIALLMVFAVSLVVSLVIYSDTAQITFGIIALLGAFIFIMLALMATYSIEVTPVDKSQYEIAASENYRVLVYRGYQPRLVRSSVVIDDLDAGNVDLFIVEKKSLFRLILLRQFYYSTDTLPVVRDLDGEIASNYTAEQIKLSKETTP